jgi:hypothetical protein
MTMEEDQILAGFHQQVQKERDKSWHGDTSRRKISRKEI